MFEVDSKGRKFRRRWFLSQYAVGDSTFLISIATYHWYREIGLLPPGLNNVIK